MSGCEIERLALSEKDLDAPVCVSLRSDSQLSESEMAPPVISGMFRAGVIVVVVDSVSICVLVRGLKIGLTVFCLEAPVYRWR